MVLILVRCWCLNSPLVCFDGVPALLTSHFLFAFAENGGCVCHQSIKQSWYDEALRSSKKRIRSACET